MGPRNLNSKLYTQRKARTCKAAAVCHCIPRCENVGPDAELTHSRTAQRSASRNGRRGASRQIELASGAHRPKTPDQEDITSIATRSSRYSESTMALPARPPVLLSPFNSLPAFLKRLISTFFQAKQLVQECFIPLSLSAPSF